MPQSSPYRGIVRVALVAETFLPSVNGVVNSVIRVADHLASAGHEPVVVAPAGVDRFVTPSGREIRVIELPRVRVPGYASLSIGRPGLDLEPVLGALDPDIVHLASPLVLGWSAAQAANRLGRPIVSVFQTDLSAFVRRYRLSPLATPLWSVLRALHSRTDLTLAPSLPTACQLRARGIGPVRVWARGVDGELFHPRRRDVELNRRLGGVGTMLVGFVGRLAPEKRVHLLAPISRLPGVKVVIVGDGPRRKSLERLMPAATFTGIRQGAELATLMASFDLLLNPGADETFCQVVQEGLASGVPVLAAASGGPLDLVRHGDNGWLWAGSDARELAAHVDCLRVDPGAVQRAARRARPSVVHRSWSRIGDELIDHYQEVINARARGRRIGADVVPIRGGARSRLRAS